MSKAKEGPEAPPFHSTSSRFDLSKEGVRRPPPLPPCLGVTPHAASCSARQCVDASSCGMHHACVQWGAVPVADPPCRLLLAHTLTVPMRRWSGQARARTTRTTS
jgi:hypothetical protein